MPLENQFLFSSKEVTYIISSIDVLQLQSVTTNSSFFPSRFSCEAESINSSRPLHMILSFVPPIYWLTFPSWFLAFVPFFSFLLQMFQTRGCLVVLLHCLLREKLIYFCLLNSEIFVRDDACPFNNNERTKSLATELSFFVYCRL